MELGGGICALATAVKSLGFASEGGRWEIEAQVCLLPLLFQVLNDSSFSGLVNRQLRDQLAGTDARCV
jgi:hypothetical protein